MNGKEIIAALEEKMSELSLTPLQLAEGDDVSDADWESLKDFCGGYSCKECGRDNEDYVVVLHFIQHDVYIKFKGEYSSWSGPFWEGVRAYEVKPEQVTVNVWKAVKS